MFKNVDNKKRYYEDIDEEKIDRNNTEELLNEEYLLINDEDNDKDNDEKCCIELNIKDIKKGTVYGNNEKTIEQLDEEDLFDIISKRLMNVIMNKMKNKENGNTFCKLIDEGNISETFVTQFLKCVMDSIPILLENKNKCYAMQTTSQLKNSKNVSNNNEDYMKNKLLRIVEVTNEVKRKRGRPRKIIQEVKLQEQIKRRGRPRKGINKSPEINKKRKFTESEDEFDSDPDYDIKQKPKASKKKKHFKGNEDEELNDGSNFETNSDLSSEDEKEEIQEKFQNVEHENENEQPDILEIENSEKL